MWHIYTMPVGTRVVSSWYHTHAHVASEMWVTAGDIERSLPEGMVLRAKAGTGSAEYVVSNGARGTFVSAQLLHDDEGKANNFSLAELQAHTLKHLPAGSLRCQYKSRNEFVKDAFFGREAARSRASAATCDDWTIQAGEQFSLLVFNYPYTGSQQAIVGGGEPNEQHNRWWPVMELDMPDWWDPEAAGSGLPLNQMVQKSLLRAPMVAKTKVDVMGDVHYQRPNAESEISTYTPSEVFAMWFNRFTPGEARQNIDIGMVLRSYSWLLVSLAGCLWFAMCSLCLWRRRHWEVARRGHTMSPPEGALSLLRGEK